MSGQLAKAAAFRALHEGPGAFVIPNPWDVGTAKILTSLGFRALATTSAGLAFALGRADGAGLIGCGETLANASAIVAASALPVTADLENGFGDSPSAVAETVRLAAGVGLVGGSIEDASGDPAGPIYEFELAVERVTAGVEAARGLGFPFTFVARAENFLHGRPDLEDTIRRLQAFERAGADVLYAPGLPDLESIRAVCSAVSKPVNAVVGMRSSARLTVSLLAEAGVRRISLGSSLSRAALGAFVRAAEEILSTGEFGYVGEALPYAAANDYFKTTRSSD